MTMSTDSQSQLESELKRMIIRYGMDQEWDLVDVGENGAAFIVADRFGNTLRISLEARVETWTTRI